MKTRICSRCKCEKDLEKGFHRNKHSWGGYSYQCKPCRILDNKKYISRNIEKVVKKRKDSYLLNKEAKKQYIIKNKEKIALRNLKNKKRRTETTALWRESNPEKTRAATKRYREKRKKENPIKLKLSESQRAAVRQACMGARLRESGLKYLGCSVEDYRKYLEALFKPGMSWDNYGRNGWNIDHKTPISWFDFTKEEDIVKAFHYTNTQPLWEKENSSKRNFYAHTDSGLVIKS